MILFLDFDGVLHPSSVKVARDGDGTIYPELGVPGALLQWAPLLESAVADIPNLEIILSTKWVWWFGIERTRAALPLGLASKVIGATWEGSWCMPEGWNNWSRARQIRYHVEQYGIDDWIAIDDDDFGLSPEDEDRWRFVICSPDRGFHDEQTYSEFKQAATYVRSTI